MGEEKKMAAAGIGTVLGALLLFTLLASSVSERLKHVSSLVNSGTGGQKVAPATAGMDALTPVAGITESIKSFTEVFLEIPKEKAEPFFTGAMHSLSAIIVSGFDQFSHWVQEQLSRTKIYDTKNGRDR